MSERLLKAIEVALLLDISMGTLNNWYVFKREHPDTEMAQLLPDPIQKAPRQTRYWRESDVPKMIEFKKNIIWGRNGFMGSITQRYIKDKEIKDETQKSDK